MTRRVEKKPRVRNDLLEAFVYIGERNVDAAQRFLTAVQADCRKLAEMPGIGAKREFRKASLRDVRSLPVTGFRTYLIFYHPIENGIEVLRVVHGARNLEDLFEEDPRRS